VGYHRDARAARGGGLDDLQEANVSGGGRRDRARWFGRARRLTTRRKIPEVLFEVLYSGGWPARLARLIGYQGPLRVNHHEIPLVVAGASVPPLRIGFVSDLHAGPATYPSLHREACRALAAWTPDLLLLGGDYVSFHARHIDRVIAPLAAIEARLGKLAAFGNHDLVGDEAYIARRLLDAGIRVLVNQSVALPAPFERVSICGLDDHDEGAPDARAAFGGATDIRIVLMHSPDCLGEIGTTGFAVAFCGHVHGGQFLLDDGRSLIHFKGEYSRKYLRGGVFRLPGPEGDRVLLVSRGIGCGSLPARRRADPEVHLCTVHFNTPPIP